MADKLFPQKHMKKLNDFAQGYTETAESSNTEEIKKLILTSEQSIYDIEYEVENNANILKQKEELKNTVAPFNEAKQTEVAKIKFCLHTLENRGIRI